ncbi:MAG TPA: hypothetical protein DDW90_04900 [Cyanobacteria bacterium UBA9971]|nr:hypothetical protein [Cyanobacteria bacterium UBA9971]
MKIDYLQIINNFVKNTKTSGVATEGMNETIKTAPEAKNTQQTTNLANQNIGLNPNQNIKFNSINRMEQANLLKGLLNLPDDIEELFSFLMYKNISPETLETLLKQNQKLNTDLIRQTLEENSKESLNKLLKLFQQAPGGTQNTEQIKEILTLLSQIIPKKDASAQEILTNLTLLYLPWLPLSEKQDIEIRFEKRESEEDDNSEQTVLVIYITTINLGRFKISIILNKDCSVKIEIENTETLTETSEYLEKILKGINEQTRKDKINAKLELMVILDSKESSKEKKREVIISPSKDVSPVLVITAQKIAKIILETDEKNSLLERRQEMVSKED